jgi:1-acyl-sn-glycerol-3-phosphate acyltransferase
MVLVCILWGGISVAKVLVVDSVPDGEVGQTVSDLLVERLDSASSCMRLTQLSECGGPGQESADTLIFLPPMHPEKWLPMVDEAQQAWSLLSTPSVKRVVVVSSAEVYGPRPHNVGYLTETRSRSYSGRNEVARSWIEYEECAEATFAAVELVILRPAPVLVPGGRGFFSQLFGGRIGVTLPGHDPTLQLLLVTDLVGAVCAVIDSDATGIYNVAPEGVITLRGAFRISKTHRVPVPRPIQGWVRRRPADQLEYVRFSWTVSNKKMKDQVGFQPKHSSVEALLEFLGSRVSQEILQSAPKLSFDDYGLDKNYIEAYRRTLFQFLYRIYWRIEYRGIENIPSEGRAVLTGVHRGLMPLDAVTTFLLIVQERKRYPRFLIHPTLIKFPFQFNFMTKLGGMIACQENADYVLSRDEILGIYPEGIHGAFTAYKDAYKLGKFGRDEYVKIALRNKAPIVPFVTVGTPEMFPILGKLNWRWWKRFSLWPCFPIAPPFPLLPVPLPSKWHILFLKPIHIEKEYPPEAAEDKAIVQEISSRIKKSMQTAMDQLVAQRKHVFWGSIFKEMNM